jgi:hypothetical protein
MKLTITDAVPGDTDAVCTLNSYYCESQAHMDEFYAKYLSPFQSTSEAMYGLEDMLLGMSLDRQCAVAEMLVSRAQYDGDMAGSGAALDPLFWVAHGAVERLMQKVIFENATSDATYDASSAFCSGHMNTVRQDT